MPYKEYLDQAEVELNASYVLFDKEFYREAVSRAYYSMFHATQALLILKEIYPKSHKGVIQKFGEEFVKPGILEKKMGYILAQAESMRLKADYDVGIKITKEECEEILENCEFFINNIKNTIKES
ncbi:MAG: HEPN domain-containing protein [Candidatus Thermoplasmatota archaeon]|nr:HEPN domain-containing protein [Candidatus Thermoplasmatota archaeon]